MDDELRIALEQGTLALDFHDAVDVFLESAISGDVRRLEEAIQRLVLLFDPMADLLSKPVKLPPLLRRVAAKRKEPATAGGVSSSCFFKLCVDLGIWAFDQLTTRVLATPPLELDRQNLLKACDFLRANASLPHPLYGRERILPEVDHDGILARLEKEIYRAELTLVSPRMKPDVVEPNGVRDSLQLTNGVALPDGVLADGKADVKKNSWVKTPENPDVMKLHNLIIREPDKNRPLIDIAREFTNGNEKSAQSLLRKRRAWLARQALANE